MLFADAELTRRIEQAALQFGADVAAAVARRRESTVDAAPAHDTMGPTWPVLPLAGGGAVHLGYGSPFNKLIALGLEGAWNDQNSAQLDTIERLFASRGAAVQAEVSTLADASVGRELTRRGYALMGFENVLGCRLTPPGGPSNDGGPMPSRRSSTDLTITARADDRAAWPGWMDALIAGFGQPDLVPGGESHESFARAALEQAMGDMALAEGIARYVAQRSGEIVGAATMRCTGGVAELSGAATLPAHRRTGIQSALLTRRLQDAAARGCDIAVVTTQPGSQSQHNAQKNGFVLLYARAILVRDPAVATIPAGAADRP